MANFFSKLKSRITKDNTDLDNTSIAKQKEKSIKTYEDALVAIEKFLVQYGSSKRINEVNELVYEVDANFLLNLDQFTQEELRILLTDLENQIPVNEFKKIIDLKLTSKTNLIDILNELKEKEIELTNGLSLTYLLLKKSYGLKYGLFRKRTRQQIYIDFIKNNKDKLREIQWTKKEGFYNPSGYNPGFNRRVDTRKVNKAEFIEDLIATNILLFYITPPPLILDGIYSTLTLKSEGFQEDIIISAQFDHLEETKDLNKLFFNYSNEFFLV